MANDNNNMAITREELNVHTNKMREDNERNIALMEKLFTFAHGIHQAQQKMEVQLSDECKQRVKAEEDLKVVKDQVSVFETKAQQLEERLTEVTKSMGESAESAEKTIAEKDEQIANAKEELKKQEALMKGLKYMRGNVDSFRLGEGILKDPCGACMLPNGCVLIADTKQGLLMFNNNTELLKHVTSEEWKWPQGLVYDKDKQILMVSMVKRVSAEAKEFKRVIGVFSLELEAERFINVPDDITAIDNVAKEKLCQGPSGELYFSMADKVGSALYKYQGGEWSVITTRQGVTYGDVQVVATTGPITEVLLVESRMGYLHKLSVRGNDVADRRTIAAVEKPGALCIDDKGRMFIQDIISGKIRVIDTFKFEPVEDVCVVQEAVYSITASNGWLGVAVRDSQMVKVFRYTV